MYDHITCNHSALQLSDCR